jgi:hypothetical protein
LSCSEKRVEVVRDGSTAMIGKNEGGEAKVKKENEII